MFSWPPQCKTCLLFWNTCSEYSFKSSGNNIVIYSIICIRQARPPFQIYAQLVSLFQQQSKKRSLYSDCIMSCSSGSNNRCIFPPNRLELLWGPPRLLFGGHWMFLPRMKRSLDMSLITQFRLVQRLWMSAVMPLD